MANFNLGSLRGWRQIGVGELLTFDVPTSGFRTVGFDVISDQFVSAKAVMEDEYWLVGCGHGQFSIKFATSEPVAVAFTGDPMADIYVRTRFETQLLTESGEVSFTEMEPHRAGPPDEVKRMMLLMKYNADRRERLLLEALQEARQPKEPPVPQPVEKPADKPKAEPEDEAQE